MRRNGRGHERGRRLHAGIVRAPTRTASGRAQAGVVAI